MRAYLAGPEVFFADRFGIGAKKARICAEFGLDGVYPLDHDPEASGEASASDIFATCVRMIRACDVVIANLTPFRGVSADVGTAAEIGYAFALGKTVHGYSNVADHLFARASAHGGREVERRDDGFAYHPDGMSIEDFGLADNLMLIEAIRASGGRFHSPAAGGVAPDDLAIFTACVAGAAPGRYAAAG